jgi:hypothetical protein
LTITAHGDVTTNGDMFVGAGFQVRGTDTTGFAGAGTELYNIGTVCGSQAYNRTSAQYLPLRITGSTVTLNYGQSSSPALVVQTDGSVALNGRLTVHGSVTLGQNNVSGRSRTTTAALALPSSTYDVFLFTAWIAGQPTLTSLSQIYLDPGTSQALVVSGTGITISTSGLNLTVTQSLGVTALVQ